MPTILKLKNIEEILPPDHEYGIKGEYADKYLYFVETHFTINGIKASVKFGAFADYVRKKMNIKENINEKFTDDDSDPIHDMGIGLVGKYLRIPQGWVRTETNRLRKRFKTIDISNEFNDWKIIKVVPDGNMIKTTLEHQHGIWKSIGRDILLTPQQIKLFLKKYKNKI
jgi:hypothetical protein